MDRILPVNVAVRIVNRGKAVMKKSVKTISVLLIILTLLAMSAPLSSATESADDAYPEYMTWSQSDSRWADEIITEKSMKESGSLVVALAKLLVHSGQRDPSLFSPSICLEELKSCGIYNQSDSMYIGLLDVDYFPTYAPELSQVVNSGIMSKSWSESEAVEKISEFINDGCYVIVMTETADGSAHWLCIDNVSDGKIYVMDNGCVCDLYENADYSGVRRYLLVKYTGGKSYPAYENKTDGTEPTYNLPDRAEIYSSPSALRVRQEYGLSGKTLRYLPLNEQITIDSAIIADGYTWGHLADGSGWCAISICKYVGGSLNFILYDVGSAEFSVNYQENPYGQSVALTDEKPTLEGYEFVGWSKTELSAKTDYLPGDTVSADGDITLYPVWKKSETGGKITVLPERVESYVTPGSLRVRSKPSLSSDSTTVKYYSEGTIITVDEAVSADGYIWGHLTDDSGWCAISICSYLSGSLYYIQYDVGNAEFSLSYQSNPAGQSVTITEEKPLLEGRKFLGWSTVKGSDKAEYSSGQTVDLDADLILYPAWEGGCAHNYDKTVVDPTEASCGYTLSVCGECGKTVYGDYVDSLGKAEIKDGSLYVTEIFAGSNIGSADELQISVNGKSVSVDGDFVTLNDNGSTTEIIVRLFGVGAVSGENCNIVVEIGEFSREFDFTADKNLLGYNNASAAVYNGYCSIILYTDYEYKIGTEFTAVTDGGESRKFTLTYASGKKRVLTCTDFGSDVLTLTLSPSNSEISGEFAISTADAENNVIKLSCSDSQAFLPYYQTKSNDADAAKKDLRFVFVANREKLENIGSANVEITFYSGGNAVRSIGGTLGGTDGDYKLFTALTAAGDIYAAEANSALFGQEIIGIPDGAYDNFTVKITDGTSGDTLLNVSLK